MYVSGLKKWKKNQEVSATRLLCSDPFSNTLKKYIYKLNAFISILVDHKSNNLS